MLILTASNITPDDISRPDGTADYDVWVGINHHCIWRGKLEGHTRDAGAAELLRLIANQMDAARAIENAMPMISRLVRDAENADGIPGAALKELRRRAANVLPDEPRERRNTYRFSDIERSVERAQKKVKK